MSRRDFCSTALAATAAAELAAAPAAELEPAGLGSDRAPAAVLFDSTIMQSRAFADCCAGNGMPVFGFAGDPSRLWLETLAQPMRIAPAALAGLTRPGALFCLERWSWESGMRVMLRVDHARTASGGWHHASAEALAGPHLTALDAAGGSFGAAAARYVIGGAGLWHDSTHATPPPESGLDGEQLVSWVIAPVRRR